jgi:hypothetical protein
MAKYPTARSESATEKQWTAPWTDWTPAQAATRPRGGRRERVGRQALAEAVVAVIAAGLAVASAIVGNLAATGYLTAIAVIALILAVVFLWRSHPRTVTSS